MCFGSTWSRSMLPIMPLGVTPVSNRNVCCFSPFVMVSSSDRPCSAIGWSGEVPSTMVAVGWTLPGVAGDSRCAGPWSGMNTSKTLSTSAVTLNASTGSRGMLRRPGDMRLLTPLQIEHELHRRPPFVGIRLGRTLLERRHQLVPASGRRVFVDAGEIPRRLERIVGDQVHEHASLAQEDLHLEHPALAQPRRDLGPDGLVITTVLADFGRIILEAQRQPERPHSLAVYAAACRYTRRVARFRLDDKVVLVTGGGSGIGAAICRATTEQGARAVVAELDPARGQAVASELGGAALFCAMDVTDLGSVQRAVATAVERFGRLDVL